MVGTEVGKKNVGVSVGAVGVPIASEAGVDGVLVGEGVGVVADEGDTVGCGVIPVQMGRVSPAQQPQDSPCTKVCVPGSWQTDIKVASALSFSKIQCI